MADATPRLTSATDASDARYAPLSWLAVVSAVLGVVFVLTLLVLGFTSYRQGKSLHIPALLLFPVAGVLAAFTARRSIRASEGARTGIEYANAGWWLSVVGGLCYFAYLFAVDWSVRSEAQRQFSKWADEFIQADPTNPNDPAIRAAFVKSIPPQRQNSALATDPRLFEAEFGPILAVFRQTNLLLIAARNRDTAKVVPLGLADWKQMDKELTCDVTAKLTCAEGEFPVTVQMLAVSGEKGREWQILRQNLFIPEDTYNRPVGNRTRFGWMVERMDIDAREAATQFTATINNQLGRVPLYLPNALGQSLALDAFVSPTPVVTPDLAEKVLITSAARLMLAGPPGLLWKGTAIPPPDFFAREDGKPLSDDERQKLLSVWDPPGFMQDRVTMPGKRNVADPARNSFVQVEANRLVVKVPVEIKPSTADFQANPNAYAVAKLVMVCDDPAKAADLAAAKAAGGPLSSSPPDDLRAARYKFRLARIESNLHALNPVSTEAATRR